MIDVQRLPEVQAQYPDVLIPRCCDRHAVRLMFGCGGWCLLFLVIPALGMSLLHFASQVGQVWFLVDLALSVGAFLLACTVCCHFCLPTLGVTVNPPPPAECTPPLVVKAENSTHRSDEVKRILLIYNPHAGKGKGEELMREVIRPGCQARGMEVVECQTEYVNHAREIGISQDLTGMDAVVALGGDGTIHEVANGLLQRSTGVAGQIDLPPLGVIPLGSGNAMAADFRQNQLHRGALISMHKEIRSVADWSLDRVKHGHSCCIDTMEVAAADQKVASISLVLFGMLAEVDIVAEPLRCMGPTRLDTVALWEMFKRKPMPPCEIRLTQPDGSVKHLSNLQQAGGRPWITMSMQLGQHFTDELRGSPQAQLDDGAAELHVFMADVPRRMLLKGFSLLPAGSASTVQGVQETYKFVDAVLTFPKEDYSDSGDGAAHGRRALQPGLFNVDGEVFRHDGEVKVKLRQRSLRVSCDPSEECEATVEEPVAAGQGQGLAIPRLRSQAFEVYSSRWLMILLFCLACGFNQVTWIAFSPIAATAGEYFNVSDWFINWLSLIFMAAYIPMTLPATYLIERLGCRPAVVMGSVLTAVGATVRWLAVWSEVRTQGRQAMPAVLMLGQTLAAIGQPFLTNMPPKLANVWFPTHQRAIADTICSMATPVGAALGFVLPDLLMKGEGDQMARMLRGEAIIAGAIAVVTLLFFRSAPPTPPSASAAMTVGAENTWVANYQAATAGREQDAPEEPLHQGPAVPLLAGWVAGCTPLAQPSTPQTHRQKSILKESIEALCDPNFLAIQASFAFGQGTLNAYSTLISQLITPFGFSEDDSSNMATVVVGGGLLGAAICAGILSYTHNHRGILMGCFTCSTIAGIAMATVIPIAGKQLSTSMFKGLTYAACALFGMTMTPVMPVAFEASVELMYPDAGEAVLSGLCMLGGQVVGLPLTLGLSVLVNAGRARIALIAVASGLVLGNVAIFFLRSKALGERRRAHEALARRNRAAHAAALAASTAGQGAV